MLAACLHPFSRNHPYPVFQIDFIPCSAPDFPAACCAIDGKFQGSGGYAFALAQIGHECSHVADLYGFVMNYFLDARRRCKKFVQVTFPSGRIVSLSVVPGSCPVQHTFHATSDSCGRFRLGFPDRLEHLQYVGLCHIFDHELSHHRIYVGLQG